MKIYHNLVSIKKDNNILYIKNNQDNLDNLLKSNVIDINNPQHKSMLNYHINSPLFNINHNITNKYSKTPEQYLHYWKITNDDNILYQYHIVSMNINGKDIVVGLFIVGTYKNIANSVQVAYSIHPKYQNLGLGKHILNMMEKHINIYGVNVDTIYGYYFRYNKASESILRNGGYTDVIKGNTLLPITVISEQSHIQNLVKQINGCDNTNNKEMILLKKDII